jgi:ferritin heavy chain
MQFYYLRDDVGLFGVSDFNCYLADKHLKYVRKLENYQIVRGGQVVLKTVQKPEKEEWGRPVDSFKYLIEMKKEQVKSCLKLHEIGEKNKDEHLKELIEMDFLEPLYEGLRKFAVLLRNVERAGTGLGEYEFNKDLELNLEKIMRFRNIRHQQRERERRRERRMTPLPRSLSPSPTRMLSPSRFESRREDVPRRNIEEFISEMFRKIDIADLINKTAY